VKAGGVGITADSNSVATLIASVRGSYIANSIRERLRSITAEQLNSGNALDPPAVENLDKWHHPKTLEELCQIKWFVEQETDTLARDFLRLAFSAILTSTTARRGEQHGFFADNTPLPRGSDGPPLISATSLFLDRVATNLRHLEIGYAALERDGQSAAVELKRYSAVQVDIRMAKPRDYGVEPHSVAAVITSPPYLCMTDYTLGHRLSYYWLDHLDAVSDASKEIGARRSRLTTPAEKNLSQYLADMSQFLSVTRQLLVPGGYLAIVLGASQAKAFQDVDIFAELSRIMRVNGFASLWDSWRDISWARNHGYAKLRQERLSVHRAD
jgi:hypothetical protein